MYINLTRKKDLWKGTVNLENKIRVSWQKGKEFLFLQPDGSYTHLPKVFVQINNSHVHFVYSPTLQ